MEFSYLYDSNTFLNNLKNSRAFLVTKEGHKVNVMQIGWGYIGYMWKRPSILISVRHSRYSYNLLSESEGFVISIPDEGEFNEELKFCGTNSGRDVDKAEECGFEMIDGEKIDVPHIKGCNSYECRILYKQSIDSELLDKQLQDLSYKNNDYHVMIYGEIVALHKK